jgi:hypothetical protein
MMITWCVFLSPSCGAPKCWIAFARINYKDVGLNLVLDGSRLSPLFFVHHHRKCVNGF